MLRTVIVAAVGFVIGVGATTAVWQLAWEPRLRGEQERLASENSENQKRLASENQKCQTECAQLREANQQLQAERDKFKRRAASDEEYRKEHVQRIAELKEWEAKVETAFRKLEDAQDERGRRKRP